jgi:hypothetical protein
MAVMVIIGIILGFVLMASMDAVRRSEERATQALIAKLEQGVSDRLEALLQTRPDYNANHLALGTVVTSTNNIPGIQRAQVIAWYDYIKAEMPDVFFIQTSDSNYPLNFAANPWPTNSTTFTCTPYVLPLGQGDNLNTQLGPAGTGVYGASYPAAAGIYKNLGYLPAGYDGVDNDSNGMVDDWGEGVSAANQALVQGNINNHKHSTARSEMLYALLVEGRGPLGSVFNRDDFTDKEVQDTDADGLPEFVDAWGQPLQFYRWPVLYHSDIQLGQVIMPGGTGSQSWAITPPYATVFQNREQDSLDPNQQLMAPAWWTTFNASTYTLAPSASYSGYTSTPSSSMKMFEYFFHRLAEPISGAGGATSWDRSATIGQRRAFYSKFLIVSGGPDEVVGTFHYPDSMTSSLSASMMLANENNAMPFGLDVVDFTANAAIPNTVTTIGYSPSNDPTNPSSSDLLQAAQDDISNQNLAATGGIGGSG